MKEIWAPVKGWEGRYEVSSTGRIRDYKGRIQPQTMIQGGYMNCYLHHNMRRKWPRVHIMVAEAFLSNEEGLPCVEHIDGVHHHNNVENLRWTYWVQAQSIEKESSTEYRPVKSVPELQCSRDGQFIYHGRKKAVTGGFTPDGKPRSLRINICIGNKHHSYQASKLMAEAWLWQYTEGDCIVYKDGDCHNIHADNLELADAEDYNNYLRRNSGYEADGIEERKRKLQLVIDEAGMTLHYFKTKDCEPINKHVKEYLYPTLMEYCVSTLHLGEKTAREQSAEAIARMYEVIINGMCLYNYERYLKKLLLNYKKTGSFGYTGAIPKPIKIIVEHLNLDCLWERYRVTKIKR